MTSEVPGGAEAMMQRLATIVRPIRWVIVHEGSLSTTVIGTKKGNPFLSYKVAARARDKLPKRGYQLAIIESIDDVLREIEEDE